ncbi:MAG TPA: argininosuccinate lyase [Methanothrix sp.]|nr:argininosuccinate lyase [Methanothrix sp.]HRW82607.1 argininosuccinate lyase [Methanothrix sp.]
MLLRGERLGEISGEVLEFISSREADRWIYEADLLVDRAHLVMLKERGLIAPEEFREIVAGLDKIDEDSLGEGEDVHEAIEAELIAQVGAVGGRMHTGRSRNDEVATCIRIVLRDEILGLMAEVNDLCKALVKRAAENAESIIPGFTHLQHAQPTTLAHHLLAHADALLRDVDRLRDSYSRVNRSPLGAAAFASTGFDIDRARTAELLGFDGLVENSMDAVSTRDFLLEALSNSAILMANLSRLAEELILWSTSEFGYVELDNLFTSTSSIMPQKKNPDTAELVRGKSGSVFGSLVAALTICKALPMSYNRDLQEATPNLWRGISTTRGAVRIMAGAVSSAKFRTDRLEAASSAGFSTATELADSLVRKTKIPFRTAHQIVGALAAKGGTPTIRDLDEAAERIAGFRPSERGFAERELKAALDPKENVAARSKIGGPAPSETKRMVADRLKRIEENEQLVGEMRGKVDGALESLREIR